MWRRVQLAADTTLEELHSVVQVAMGWKDAHLHLFIVNGEEYGETDPEFGATTHDENEGVLSDIVREGDRFVYVYDFGDDWNHQIQVESTLPDDKTRRLPCCIVGEHACPPEDCGGPPGYARLLEILVDPKHTEYQDTLYWLGDDFDPEAFDLAAVNRSLRHI